MVKSPEEIAKGSHSVFARHPIGFGKNDLLRWSFSAAWSRLEEFKRLSKRLHDLKVAAIGQSIDSIYEELCSFPEFRADQKRTEILNLLEVLREKSPRYVCEIGSALGGTLFLLANVSAPDATIISIDLGASLARRLIYARMANESQRIFCLNRDSRSAETLQTVKSILRGNKLDFLLIDGDHSFEGVQTDFRNYSRLVRKSGLIALHDIVEDYSTARGVDSGTWAGDVPAFWKMLGSKFKTETIVEDPNQDGYGLGLVHL